MKKKKKKKSAAIVFTLIGIVLGYYSSPLCYYFSDFRQDVRKAYLPLNTIQRSILNGELLYLDDHDRREMMKLRLELAYIENMTLFNLNELKRIKWWVRYLDRYGMFTSAQISNRTEIFHELKELKETHPDGILVSAEEFEQKIEEARQKDAQWSRGWWHGSWPDGKEGIIKYDVPRRDYFLCNNRLVPCSFEEGVRNRYRIQALEEMME